jgi:hypothetical protein
MSGHEGHDMGGHEGHDMGGHEGHDMGGQGADPHAKHMGMMIMMHSKAAATDVPNGARIELTVGAADVGKLQSELRMHAQHLASGTCSMGGSHGDMHGDAHGAPAQADPHAGHH